MADHDLLGDFNAENQPEDFEKVDKFPDQDEEISSSYVGEEAEADRYEPGNDPVDKLSDLINIGSSGQSAFANNDPFTSYESPEPTAPPKEVGDLMSTFEKDSNELMKNQETEPQQIEVPKPPMKGKLFSKIKFHLSLF